MVQSAWNHQTVLLNEAVQALGINPDGHYVDATFGRGGHSRLILEQLSRKGRLTAFDKDPQAVAAARSHLAAYPKDRLVLRTPASATPAAPAASF